MVPNLLILLTFFKSSCSITGHPCCVWKFPSGYPSESYAPDVHRYTYQSQDPFVQPSLLAPDNPSLNVPKYCCGAELGLICLISSFEI